MQSFDLLDSDLMVPMDEGLGAQPSAETELVDRQLISRLILILSPRQERVVRLYYGIGGPPVAVGDIADEFGLTRSRIDALRKDALGRMARAAARIDDAEPGMIADRKYPLPRAWAVVDSETVNTLFVKRLSEARNAPMAPATARSATPPKLVRTRGRHNALVITKVAAPAKTSINEQIRRRHSRLVEMIILIGYPFVLPIGTAGIIAGAHFGGWPGLITGIVFMAIVAFIYDDRAIALGYRRGLSPHVE